MAINKKKSFLLYVDNYTKTIGKLSYEQKGMLLDAIYHKAGATNVNKPDLDLLVEMAFEPISIALERNEERYSKVCEERSKAGKKGGRPKGSTKKQIEAKKQKVL